MHLPDTRTALARSSVPCAATSSHLHAPRYHGGEVMRIPGCGALRGTAREGTTQIHEVATCGSYGVKCYNRFALFITFCSGGRCTHELSPRLPLVPGLIVVAYRSGLISQSMDTHTHTHTHKQRGTQTCMHHCRRLLHASSQSDHHITICCMQSMLHACMHWTVLRAAHFCFSVVAMIDVVMAGLSDTDAPLPFTLEHWDQQG